MVDSGYQTKPNGKKILTVISSLDPRLLAVNRRYYGKQVTPPEVREAQNSLIQQVKLTARSCMFELVDKRPTFKIELWLYFPTRRADLDGPVKRIVDAVFSGLWLATDFDKRFNDRWVDELHIRRITGPPAIWIKVEEL